MTIRRITQDDVETFTLELHPSRTYKSSSKYGVTGSVYVFPRHSTSEKEIPQTNRFVDDSIVDDVALGLVLKDIKEFKNVNDTTNISNALEKYLSVVNDTQTSVRKQQLADITRWIPPVKFDSGTLRKNVVRKNLFPYYRSEVPSADWSFTNYNVLNFFTASSVPSDSAMLYPNSASSTHQTYASGVYSLTGAFSFDFYVNPRYTTDVPHGNFHAGTIFHLSSSYAVSLVSGSRKDVNGYVDGYRIQLQLSHSADVKPSLITASNQPYPHDLVFLSNDNALQRNRWHHVSIRWGTSDTNGGIGSIYVDGLQKGTFDLPSSSIAPPANVSNPGALVIGNYYEGSHLAGDNVSLFFAHDPALRDGLIKLTSETGVENPPNYTLDHPLNAEVHELKIYRRMLNDDEMRFLTQSGPSSTRDLAFYVPPFFTRESPTRRAVGTSGGILQTPFFTIDGTTDDPFNVALSFGVNGHDINLENYTRDFANGLYPRLLNLTMSQINTTTQALTANQFLYSTASVRKRNVTILPCDNGRFKPNFRLLMSGNMEMTPELGHPMDHFVNDFGALDLSVVSLNELILTSSLRPGLLEENSANILSGVVGSTPESPGVDPGETLAIYQRTRDNSSNEVVFFNVSNIFYGNMIQPETFVLTDNDISGTNGKLKITLKDDGYGNLYRADSDGKHAKWSSVGTLLYKEGIVTIKTPVIPFFGQDGFETSFKGNHNVHTLKLHALAPAGMINSSSNPNFMNVSASLNANDTDREFVYIGSVLFHDDNLNVVMKANLAQPIVKRHGQSVKFLIRMQY